MAEEDLNNDDKHPVIRIGNTVHRPVNWWTPAVHGLLNYLEQAGFKYSPRVLGFDKEGREVLSYIDGQSGKDGWQKILSDEGLSKFAKLLRDYHDAVAGYKPDKNAEWANGTKGLGAGNIICHGDFGPWNIVWQGEDLVGIVDRDLAMPAKAEYDILYALEYSAPFRDDERALKWHHFPKVPDRKHRIDVFLEAYGAKPIAKIADKVAQMQRDVAQFEGYLAARGAQPQVDWVAAGDLDECEKRAHWTESNKHLFE